MPCAQAVRVRSRDFSLIRKLKMPSRDNLALFTTGSASMLDLIFLAVGCGCFAVAIAYSYACDRL